MFLNHLKQKRFEIIFTVQFNQIINCRHFGYLLLVIYLVMYKYAPFKTIAIPLPTQTRTKISKIS